MYLAVICRRTLGWDCVLNTEAEQGPVSPLLVYSASGHYSRHLRGKCHKIHTHTNTNPCLNFFALLSPTAVLLIWKSLLLALHSGCVSSRFWTLSITARSGEVGEAGCCPCACPKINFISETPELFPNYKCLKKKVERCTISCLFNAGVLKVLIGMPGISELKGVLVWQERKTAEAWGEIKVWIK